MLRRVARISMSLNSRPLATTSTRLDATKIAELEAQLQGNPYFQKFQDRIIKLKESDPETYVKRLELMLDQTEKQKQKEQGSALRVDAPAHKYCKNINCCRTSHPDILR